MGYFDLPTGHFELLLKKKGRGNYKAEWRCVAITDSLYKKSIAEDVERWSKDYTVLEARFNGRKVAIPTNYVWELKAKEELIGTYATYEEAASVRDERKHSNRKKPKEERIPVGCVRFAEKIM